MTDDTTDRAPVEREAALADKVAFLSSPEAYPHHPERVVPLETHMSWVFLTGSLVYKLKKPVRYPFLDFSTVARRRDHCHSELLLNRRLAGTVYRRIVALHRHHDGSLSLDTAGDIVDYLVQMQQLPQEDMLDSRIRSSRVGNDEVIALGTRLGHFYASAAPHIRDGQAYIEHLLEETRLNRDLLTGGRFHVPHERTAEIVTRVEALLGSGLAAIAQRIEDGRIVEGHGDMRPEHVSLRQPLPIIDCLEFDRRMRLLDPYDEVNYLGLECEFLGAGWIRPLLLGVVEDILGHRPTPRLLCTYAAFRAVLRARISLAHLLDEEPQEPERWPHDAAAYLTLAEEECRKAGG